MVDTWTKIGTVAAVIAAIGTAAAVGVSWWYGKRSVRDAHKAVTYDRLREARELVGKIKVNGDNTRWAECHEAAAQLRSLIATVGIDLPASQRLAAIEWDLDKYSTLGLQAHVDAARDELDASTRTALG